MIQFVSLMQSNGALLWGRIGGSWGPSESLRLQAHLDQLDLPSGSHLILDFAQTKHMHFRSVPLLIDLAGGLEERGVSLEITGLSDYLRRIVELGSALDGRELIERHQQQRLLLPGAANQGCRFEGLHSSFELDPHGLAVASLN